MSKYFFWFLIFTITTLRLAIFYANTPKYPDGTMIRLTESVLSEPVRYSDSQYLKVAGYKIYLPLYPEVSYGDKVVVEGVVEGSKLKKAELIKLIENKNFLTSFRKNLLDVYQKSFPYHHASLVAGIVLGSKRNITSEFWNSLKVSGTAHVVVASGMNVSLFAKFLIGALAIFMLRRKALLLALVGVWFYAALSGFEPPVIRAAIMASFAYVAQEIGRIYFAWRILVISGLGMLIVNPAWITDLGFILSFVATASLILFEPKISRLIRRVPGIIREDLSTSIAAQIGVGPILFAAFGQFNPLSVLANVLVLWTVVPLTLLGMFGGLIGLIYEPLGKLILWTSYPLTLWFVSVVDFFS